MHACRWGVRGLRLISASTAAVPWSMLRLPVIGVGDRCEVALASHRFAPSERQSGLATERPGACGLRAVGKRCVAGARCRSIPCECNDVWVDPHLYRDRHRSAPSTKSSWRTPSSFSARRSAQERCSRPARSASWSRKSAKRQTAAGSPVAPSRVRLGNPAKPRATAVAAAASCMAE